MGLIRSILTKIVKSFLLAVAIIYILPLIWDGTLQNLFIVLFLMILAVDTMAYLLVRGGAS